MWRSIKEIFPIVFSIMLTAFLTSVWIALFHHPFVRFGIDPATGKPWEATSLEKTVFCTIGGVATLGCAALTIRAIVVYVGKRR